MGIFAIYKVKTTLYSFLLINLSATEILILLHHVMKITGKQVYRDVYQSSFLSKIVTVLWHIGEWEFFATMIIILISRAIATIFPLKYMVYNGSPSKVKHFLLATWIFSITYGFVFSALEYHKIITPKVHLIYFATLYSLYTMLALITYVIIAKKRRQSQQNVNSARNIVNNHSERLCLMSTLIIVTFIVFNAIPTCLWSYRPQWSLYSIWAHHTGYILEPLIYIYINHKYRAIIVSIFKWKTNNTTRDFPIRSDKEEDNDEEEYRGECNEAPAQTHEDICVVSAYERHFTTGDVINQEYLSERVLADTTV